MEGGKVSILTWNINGIRAAKTPLRQLFDSLDADIICLQETKVTRDQIDEQTAIVEGYNSYFSYSRTRSGYSGVATFVKDHVTPVKAEQGLTGQLATDPSQSDQTIGCYGDQSGLFSEEELSALDREGRCIITEHAIRVGNEKKLLVVINVYCPRADPDRPDRLNYKLQFFQLLQLRAGELVKDGRHVVIVGDFNVAHQKIDHCDPDDDEEFYSDPGRKWMDELLQVDGPRPTETQSAESLDETTTAQTHQHLFIDTFRLLHRDEPNAYTNWCTTTGARATNYGRRLDYIVADRILAETTLRSCTIMRDVQGSDHCPVKSVFGFVVTPPANRKCPSLCTKYMPEFSGRQQKLLSFLTKTKKVVCEANDQGTSHKIVCEETDVLLSQSEAMSHSQQSIVKSCGVQDASVSNLDFSSNGLLSSQTGELQSKSRNGDITQMSATKTGILGKRSVSDSSKLLLKKSKSESASVVKQQGNLLSFFTKQKCEVTAAKISSTPNGLPNVGSEQPVLKYTENSFKPTGCTNLLPNKESYVMSSGQSCVGTENVLSSLVHCEEPTFDDLSSADKTSASDSNSLLDQCGSVKSDSAKQSAESNSSNSFNANSAACAWRSMLKGPPQAPLCKGHQEPCVLREVKKDGPNKGRQFWVCNKPQGHKSNPDARCDYFVWINNKSK